MNKATTNTSKGFVDYIKANTSVAIILGAGVLAVLTIAGALAFGDIGSSKPVADKVTSKPASSQPDNKEAQKTRPTTQVASSANSTATRTSDVAVISPKNVAATFADKAPVSGPQVQTAETTPVDAPATPAACVSPVASKVLQNTATTTTFDKARVSLTFDDGWKSIHTGALSLLNKYCLTSTQYLNSQPIITASTPGMGYEDYMTYQDVRDFYAAGNELAWHTQTHADLTTLSAADRDTELTVPADFSASLDALKVPTTFTNFATPYGAYNAATFSGILAGNATAPTVANDGQVQSAILAKYGTHRSVDDGYNAKVDGTITDGATNNKYALDVSNIHVQNVLDGTTTGQVQSWVDNAIATNTWLVIVYHEVKADTAPTVEDYSVTAAKLETELSYIKQSGIAVETVQTAVTELKAQM